MLRGGWRPSLNRFNLCTLVRLITMYKYRSGRNENEVSYKPNKIKRQSTWKYFSSRYKKVFPKSSYFSSGNRKPELCKLINVILWYLLQVRFATGGSRCSFYPLTEGFMHFSYYSSLGQAVFLPLYRWGEMRWWDLPDAIHANRERGPGLASEVIPVLLQPLGNSAWLLEVLVMQWEKCNQRMWVTDLNF